MTFDRKRLSRVSGRLVPIDGAVTADRKVAKRVAAMQRDLVTDPKYHDLFTTVVTLARPIEVEALAQFTVDTMRDLGGADAAFSTASSFRQALPAGAVDLETLRAAMPYDNEIVVAQISGKTLRALVTRASTTDPADDARSFSTSAPEINPERTYSVAVTDYMAKVSPSFRDLFRGANLISTGLHVRVEVLKRLQSRAP